MDDAPAPAAVLLEYISRQYILTGLRFAILRIEMTVLTILQLSYKIR